MQDATMGWMSALVISAIVSVMALLASVGGRKVSGQWIAGTIVCAIVLTLWVIAWCEL